MIAGVRRERERICLARPLWCLGPGARDGIRLTRAATTCARAACYSQLVNSSPNAGMQLICCGAGGTFFSLLLFLRLPLLLLQPSLLSPGSAAGGGSDATCQADSFLSIWAKVVISWRCGGEGWVGRKKWVGAWGV